jgi:hypothetical protein
VTTFGPAGLRLAAAALLVLLCAAHCTHFLRSTRRDARAADTALAQIAMAGLMAWLLLTADPPRVALTAAFGAAAAWFTVRAVRGYVGDGPAGAAPFYGHAACCSAMSYLLAAPWLAAVAEPGHAGMTMGPGVPALTLVAVAAVLAALVVSSQRTGAVLFARAGCDRRPADGALLTAGGRWALDVLTLAMLLAML